MTQLESFSWPVSALDTALRELVREAGLVKEPPHLDEPDVGAIESWLSDAGARLGVDIVSVSNTCGELDDMLRRLGPSFLLLPGTSPSRFLVVIGGGSFGLKVLTPNDGKRRLDRSLVFDALISPLLESEQASARELFQDLGLASEVGTDAAHAFAKERISGRILSGIWLFRPLPGNAVDVQARVGHLPILVALLVVARVMSTGLFLMLWLLVGRDVFGNGSSESSTPLLILCALSAVPFRMLDAWAQSRLSVDSSLLLKESLFYGILHVDRKVVQERGAGQFLSMVMQGEVFSAATQSGLTALGSFVDLAVATYVLGMGIAGINLATLFLLWFTITVGLCWRYAQHAKHWSKVSEKVTHDLVERMVGYQTRLAQERPEDRHREEDALLHEYVFSSQELDRRKLFIDKLVSTCWLILGIAVLEPALVAGVENRSALALALGGVLMAGAALKQFVAGAIHLSDTWVAWQEIAPVLQAGRRATSEGVAGAEAPKRHNRSASSGAPLLRFNDISLRYAENAPVVLRQCSQEIRSGDRILLEGPSGGGKSSLAMVLAGLRDPDAGAVWLGDERHADMAPNHIRRRVVLVPQFHDNHILSESLLFNLLLGRHWPATAADMQDATAVCDLLGLTPLVERMPQGLAQPVGDAGWMLSHGERSRIFLARSLLQEDVELVILDESFAALDPETLRLSCQGVLASAPTLLVIAHP